ncbi:hypothetical protein [uncultured Shewanella sp.]|uniref:hypothetical protein n=1 Tax=uncultured Shewanella sp. TaxID=173975 RepID=UPI002631339D|nr:hypothetical protein [uncultured Shewanella sp.]
MTEINLKEIDGILVPGYQVASGLATDSPYTEGTIAIQSPYFLKEGLDLSFCYSGTLNIDIEYEFSLSFPDFEFKDIKWAEYFPSESFSFFKCFVFNGNTWQIGYIYYPHPDTKLGHFQKRTVIEIVTAKIEHIHYGDPLTIKVESSTLTWV